MDDVKNDGHSSQLLEANSSTAIQSKQSATSLQESQEQLEGLSFLSDAQLELDMDLMFVGDHDDIGDDEGSSITPALDDDLPVGAFEVSDDSNSSAGSSSGARLAIRSSRVTDRSSDKGMFPSSLPINVGVNRGHNFGGRRQGSEDDDTLLIEEEEEELFGPRGQLWVCGQSFNDFELYKDRMSKAMNRKTEEGADFFNDIPVGRFSILEASTAARLRPA